MSEPLSIEQIVAALEAAWESESYGCNYCRSLRFSGTDNGDPNTGIYHERDCPLARASSASKYLDAIPPYCVIYGDLVGYPSDVAPAFPKIDGVSTYNYATGLIQESVGVTVGEKES